MTMPPEKISVIVPVYSADAYLLEMLERLFLPGLRLYAGRRVELVLIDDASPLGRETEALARAAQQWADVVHYRNSVNLGYVRSVNKGLSLATGDRLLVCNSDTRLAPLALARLEAALDADERLGMAGPVSNSAFNAKLQQCARLPRPLASFSAGELAALDVFGRAVAAAPAAPVEAAWLLGFCTLIRRKVVEEIGPLDEGFGFGYLEELDYAVRARRAGWRLAVVPDAFVFHGGLRRGLQAAGPNAGSQTARAFRLRTFFRIARGFVYLVCKHGWKAARQPQDGDGASDYGRYLEK